MHFHENIAPIMFWLIGLVGPLIEMTQILISALISVKEYRFLSKSFLFSLILESFL